MVSDELDSASQGLKPSPSPRPLQLTAPPHPPPRSTLPTCVFADPSFSCYISERQDAPGEVTGLGVHFDEGVRAHVTVGIVGDVDGVASGALSRQGRRVSEQDHL